MSVTIGGKKFRVDPLSVVPELDTLADELQYRPFPGFRMRPMVPLFKWACGGDPAAAPGQTYKISLDCEVHVAVMRKSNGRMPPRRHKKKSAQLAKRVRAFTGLKTNALIAAAHKAIGPAVITLDTRPYIAKYGKDFSFEILIELYSDFFILRPENGPADVYFVVGIPLHHAFFVDNVRPCREGLNALPHDRVWTSGYLPNSAHEKWKAVHAQHEKSAAQRWHKRQRTYTNWLFLDSLPKDGLDGHELPAEEDE